MSDILIWSRESIKLFGKPIQRLTSSSSENEANKRKSQQLQKKWEESEAKEQAHWQKLQQYMQLFEESQFEKNEVRILVLFLLIQWSIAWTKTHSL